MRASGPWDLDWPVFWAEKVSVLLLAAHLEGEGLKPLLSVPLAERFGDPHGRGLDWALVVKTALRLGRPLGPGDHAQRRAAYQATPPVTGAERVNLRRDVRAILQRLVAGEKAYRYDGIWHDGGGNIDLRAYRDGQEALAVEAKGAIASGTRVSWSQARHDVQSLVEPADAFKSRRPASYALLIPDDRGVAREGAGFVATLLRLAKAEDDWRVFLVDRNGGITDHRVNKLKSS
jgi:hypothetical protein